MNLFVLFAMICSFLISADYALIRPVSSSLFISAYGASFLPFAWLAVLPVNFVCVWLYNRYLARLGILRMFFLSLTMIASVTLLAAFFLKESRSFAFLYYVWKDIYILFMFQQLWSLIHATVDKEKAKYLYGIIFAVGGSGGIIGSLVPGFFAQQAGSENLLFFSLPLYLLLAFFYFLTLKHSSSELILPSLAPKEAAKRILSSRTLTLILFIVTLMQISVAIVDYQFNHYLDLNIHDKDLRTQYFGRVMSFGGILTVVLQLFGSYLFVRWLGLRKSHILIPAALGFNALGFLLFPAFGMITYSFVTIKAFDFSLFGILKEMLYLPLKLEEKFQAKAFIDIFAYRSAKVFASLIILSFQFLNFKMLSVLSWSSLGLFLVWAVLTTTLIKKEEKEI